MRAPDNIVYLDSYWCMKGYDTLVMPRTGDPVLIVLEPQLEEAERTSWTQDLRLFDGYHPDDPRPPWFRSLDAALDVLRERDLTGRIGLELSQGTQACDLMVAEQTVFSQPWFDAFKGVCREVVDASGLLAEARAIKTAQEIERMRLAAELARGGDGARTRPHPSRDEDLGGRRALRGIRARQRRRLQGSGRDGAGVHARLVGLRISARSRPPATRTWPSTSRRCSRSGWSPTATGAI